MRLIKRIKNSKLYNDNRGSAMIVAIVVSIIVIAFTLSLLLVSYSLFTSSSKKITQSQVKELAKSIGLEIGDELTSVNFDSSADLLAGINNYADSAFKSEDYNLWYYIRYNLFQTNWPYYADASTAGHIDLNAYRYFDVNISGGDSTKYAAMADDISVRMYWSVGDISEKDETQLTVEVTVKKGDQSYIFTTYYELTVSDYEDVDIATDNTQNNAFNPNGNSIDLSEKWNWVKIN
ncbi:MAG: hypothetical protein IJ763_09360 [Lachnospiraceae bacterium]|nr:hypothetical protein [Lachnospiraceae bacterium]